MKQFLLSLALLCGSAHAQVFTLPDCIPKTIWTPFGTGTDWVRGQAQPNDPGPITSYRAWWCPNPDGTWTSYLHLSIERPEWTLNLIDTELSTVFRSLDRRAALRDLVNRYNVAPTDLERPSWNAAAQAGADALLLIKPGPPSPAVWRVPASGSSLYTAAAGKLVSKIAGRTASPNALCDATNPIAVGTSTYMPLVGGPASEVTLCKKVSP
jgi:hypothetical protein